LINKQLTVDLYQSINARDRQREINHWHCSSLAKCPRALFLERKQVAGLPDNEPGGGKKLRWRAGHAIEGTIRPELKEKYPNLLANIRMTSKALDLTGEFDGYDPDTKALVSVKSVHDFAMITRDGEIGLKEEIGTKMGRNGREVKDYALKTDPYHHHEWQEASYAILQEEADTTAQQLVIVGHAKVEVPIPGWVDGKIVTVDTIIEERPIYDNVPIKFIPGMWPVEQITYVYITLGGLIACYSTPVKPEILQRVKIRLESLKDCWANNKLPICACHEEDEMWKVQNQYCPYRNQSDCCSASLLEVATV
jgi:hypothetical protein